MRSKPLYKSLILIMLALCVLGRARAADSLSLPTLLVKSIDFPGIQYPGDARDSSSFTVPFTKVGNLLLIRARADSTEGNFILDTGCPGLVLNITYFRNYQRTVDHEMESQGMTGNATATEQVTIKKFHFGTVDEFNVKANLANLGSIENSKGVRVLGLIGMQFLEGCEVFIDYQQNLLLFHVIAKKEVKTYRHEMLADTAAYHIIPFEITENRIIVKTTLAGKKLRFIIDCAAETNIIDSRLPDKIFANLDVTGKVSLVGVGNTKVEALTGSLETFTIGNRIITDMPVLITNLGKTCLSYGGCIDGILGLDNLSVQKIGFNFTTFKMYIWK
ncbi:MAG: hypothetical protein EOP54_22680 [Sphingobacteriales bacterium]|nr:MAG: hypothetical protein EOP54_22680 [Sphingobacteriales bacterium]